MIYSRSTGLKYFSKYGVLDLNERNKRRIRPILIGIIYLLHENPSQKRRKKKMQTFLGVVANLCSPSY